MTTFPSQYRDGADHVWRALQTDKTQGLKDIVETACIERSRVQLCLSLAKAGSGVDGLNGRWSRHVASRVAFRDAVVLGLLRSQGNSELTMAQIVGDLAGLASSSQVYGSLARLQAKDLVKKSRDGSRSPLYSLGDPE